MVTANFHAVLLHVLVGLSFAFPLIMVFLKMFKITNPAQRIGLYLLGLFIPLISLTLYHTILTKRCEMTLLDTLCQWGIAFARFFLPFAGILFIWGLLKLIFAKVMTYRLQKKAVQSVRIESILQQCCKVLNQKVPPLLVVSHKGFAAMVIGLFRPVLVVNEEISKILSDEELERVVMHELVHIQRGDCMLGWIMTLTRDMMFYNPISTLFLKGYLLERERLCDLKVANIYEDKAFYLATLLKVWKLLVEEKEKTYALGAARLTGTQKEMTYRVTSLMNETPNNGKVDFVLFIAVQAILIASSLYLIGLIC
jgi:beta-lactamase regulating signal transducer with metallopeptidase domain